MEKAPAKINLTLEVLGRRPDGFHEMRSVMQTIDICDTLYFDDAADIKITSDLVGWSAPASLVIRAVKLMREAGGSPGGVSVKVEKHIPLLAGLGGDSSDAAATLRGLDRLWGLGLSLRRAARTGEQAGLGCALFSYRQHGPGGGAG